MGFKAARAEAETRQRPAVFSDLSPRPREADARVRNASVDALLAPLRDASAVKRDAPVVRCAALGPVRVPLLAEHRVQRNRFEGRAHHKNLAWREVLHGRHDAGKGLLATANVVAHVEMYLERFRHFIPGGSPQRSQQDVERHAGRRGRFSKRQLRAAAMIDPHLLHNLEPLWMVAHDITDDLMGLDN